jgi:hypothetical protein
MKDLTGLSGFLQFSKTKPGIKLFGEAWVKNCLPIKLFFIVYVHYQVRFYLVNTVGLFCVVQTMNFMLNAVLAEHERDLNAMYNVHCCCMIEKDVLVSCMTVTSLVPVSEGGAGSIMGHWALGLEFACHVGLAARRMPKNRLPA